MERYFADLHIHIGSAGGSSVKITASRDLTVSSILNPAAADKGLDIIGIIDCLSPPVRAEIEELISAGEISPAGGGGYLYRSELLLLPGMEVETREENGGQAHYLAFFPHLSSLTEIAGSLDDHITNMTLSSQTCYLTGSKLLELVGEAGGILIPAHVFTPHCSFYGSACRSYEEIFTPAEWQQIPAVELGLSADRYLASHLSELDDKTLLSNSDAHSLPKLAREYNLIEMEDLSFAGFASALRGESGGVDTNYGLDPRLGKYHRSYCPDCEKTFTRPRSVRRCPLCGSERIIQGVKDRILEIADRKGGNEELKSDYVHQVPLLDLPGLGPATLRKLQDTFGTEMDILHSADHNQLREVAGERIADRIIRSRRSELEIISGGGGEYGSVRS